MANRFYTFIIVPNASAQLQKIRIPASAIKAFAVLGIVSFLLSAFLLFTYIKMVNQVADYQKLAAENTELKIHTKNLEFTTRKLGSRLSDLQIMSDRLNNLIESEGLGRRIGRMGGVGGSREDVSTARLFDRAESRKNLDLMKDQTTELEGQMKLLEQLTHERVNVVRSTPSTWPVKGPVTSHFGSRTDPFNGGREFHMGLDISALYGSAVRAPADALVLVADRQAAYGNLIVLSHGRSVTTRYGHLSRFAVKPGQRIRRGEIIGYVGTTGRTTSPHLHYEVRVNDRPVNPRTFLIRG